MKKNPATPALLLRLEGAALFIVALAVYRELGLSWWLFVLLFLMPDLSFLGYFGGTRVGAMVYNAAHTYTLPAGLWLLGFWGERGWMMGVALIWAAHIGLDRLIGFGLKYPTVFKPTHLQQVALEPQPPPTTVSL